MGQVYIVVLSFEGLCGIWLYWVTISREKNFLRCSKFLFTKLFTSCVNFKICMTFFCWVFSPQAPCFITMLTTPSFVHLTATPCNYSTFILVFMLSCITKHPDPMAFEHWDFDPEIFWVSPDDKLVEDISTFAQSDFYDKARQDLFNAYFYHYCKGKYPRVTNYVFCDFEWLSDIRRIWWI